MAVLAPEQAREIKRPYEPAGAALELFRRRDREIVLSGPAGTGKSRACLEKIHLMLLKFPGAAGLMVRKTRTDLTGAAMVTFSKKVIDPLDGLHFKGATTKTPAQYSYPNGSVLMVAGLDRDTRNIMSQEIDVAYVQEATELTLDDWETLTTRFRDGVMPFRQLIADCNPDAPTHWLKQRADRGQTAMIESRHEDNPTLFNKATGEWTDLGKEYVLGILESLTGARKARLRYGIWSAAEGMIYEEDYDAAINLVPWFKIPKDWRRYWVVDFGYTHPFVCQFWAEDGDGRLYMYREIYWTQKLVEDHAKQMMELTQFEPRPQAIICDHDAEGRATLEKYVGMLTTPAQKAVSDGIQAAAARLRPRGDGKPGMVFLRDALVRRDPKLNVIPGKPCCTVEEFPSYVYNLANGKKRGEEPVKEDDHGMDCMRYMAMYKDRSKEINIRFV